MHRRLLLAVAVVALPLGVWGAFALTRPTGIDLAPPPAPQPLVARPKLADRPKAFPAKLIALDASGRPYREETHDDYKVVLDLSSQSVTIAAPKQEDWRTSLDQFRIGDTVETITADAEFQVDEQTVVKLPRGIRLGAQKVEKDRVAVAARVGAEIKQGWVAAKQLKLAVVEPRLQTLPVVGASPNFVSAAVLIQKAKQFDDGLYAAVEIAAQDGLGDFAGKKQLLAALTATLGARPPTKAAGVVAGASLLGGAIDVIPASLQAAAQSASAEFFGNQLRAKPLGFYTWNDRLDSIFRQDRLLQAELTGGDGAGDIAQVLRDDAAARKTYAAYIELIEQLTNPSDYADLRGASTPDAVPIGKRESFRIVPPSRSYENSIVKRLFANRVVPQEFNLMATLVDEIRSGRLDVTPKKDSGWYDRQTYALAPLLSPELPGDPQRLRFEPDYRQHLTELFKGALALTRETHVKQLEIATTTSARMPVKIYLRPEFTLEPLAEMYQRRAESYRFIRAALERTFGAAALNRLHRQTADGHVGLPLNAELQRMTDIFDGAAVVAAREAGLTSLDSAKAKNAALQAAAADVYLQWAADLDSDDDLARDARMMVPVFYDEARGKTKVWVFLGWQSQRITFTFNIYPRTSVVDPMGRPVSSYQGIEASFGPELIWTASDKTVVTPVMAEVYVSMLLDRDEFRKHCDAFVTRTAILANLE